MNKSNRRWLFFGWIFALTVSLNEKKTSISITEAVNAYKPEDE